MAKKKKNTQGNHELAVEDASKQFGIALKDLENLMQTRGQDGMREINDIHGGLSGIGQKLKTNLISGKSLRLSLDDHCFSFLRFIRR